MRVSPERSAMGAFMYHIPPLGGGIEMSYVDGFLIAVPKKNVKAYTAMARWGKKMWMKHGALQYFECLAHDLKTMPGCGDFPKLVKLKKNETLFYSFIVYKSKAQRDAVNKKVMQEMMSQPMPKMPFDTKRMAHGGFKTIVEG
jgi:uncharacterized protein YbaA (DUF1428 family)